MPTPAWTINGQYYETCSCDFVCPCILKQMTAKPTKGWCLFSMAFKVEDGSFGGVPLGGRSFVVLGRTPEAMGKGNWSVGLIVDDQASAEQRDAIAAIVSGQAGGPMAVLSGLVTNFLGVESAPIQFSRSGVTWTVKAPPFVDMGAQGAMGIDPTASEPLHLVNTGHPANDRLALCNGTRSHVHALGLDWDDSSGLNNGHYAPFVWQSA